MFVTGNVNWSQLDDWNESQNILHEVVGDASENFCVIKNVSFEEEQKIFLRWLNVVTDKNIHSNVF